MMNELENFDLEVEGSETAGYMVKAAGPAGERASAPFGWALLADLSDDLQAIQEGMTNRAALERVGTALFQALFPPAVLRVYDRLKPSPAAGEGLRLRLHLPPELAHLPWELLNDPPSYLSADPRSPVVRFLDLPDTPRPLAIRPPIRLLHLVASPVDSAPLDVEREMAQLRSALTSLVEQGKLEIIPAQPGTLAALREGLRQGCHILHFSGHGGHGGPSGGMGYLLFEDEERHGERVNGDTLAPLLRGTDVRLAILNACESAAANEGQAFGSVAEALVRAGLPAVIAHQYALPDRSAIPFAIEFYRALAEGFPVDVAVSEGRKAILSELGSTWQDGVDWATPVLFMRAPDGHIMSLEEETASTEGQPMLPGVQQTITMGDVSGNVITLGDVSGGTLTVGGVNIGVVAPPATVQTPTSQPTTERLLALLAELRQLVRDQAPDAKVAQAADQVAALKSAATGQCPDLDMIESVLKWFEAELPQLVGAVFNVIGGIEQRVRETEDDLLPEFRRRFGEFL
jgi:CHAT domain